jgi:hypothetical protein
VFDLNYFLRETTIAAPARAATARPTPAAAPEFAFEVLSEAVEAVPLPVDVVVLVVDVVEPDFVLDEPVEEDEFVAAVLPSEEVESVVDAVLFVESVVESSVLLVESSAP